MSGSEAGAIYANLVIGVVNVSMTVVAVQIIDRVDRQPLLFAGVAGMAGSLLVLGISLSALSTPHHPCDEAAVIRWPAWAPSSPLSRPPGYGGVGDDAEVLPLSVRGTRWCRGVPQLVPNF